MKHLCILPLIFACHGSSGTADSTVTDAVLKSLAEDVVAERYAALQDATMALSAGTESCETVTDMDAIKALWWAAKSPWKQMEVVLFGPVVEYPARLGPKIDDWPVNSRAITELLDSEDGLSAADFALKGSIHRGFPVIEHLLWTDPTHPRTCEALKGATADLAANAATLSDAWASKWIPKMSEGQAALNEWVNRMGFAAYNIRDTKLGKPVGDYTNGTPQPDTIESRPSGRSLTDARDALDGIQLIWTGQDDLGIRALLPDPSIQTRIDDILAVAIDRLASVPEPLEATIYTEPEVVDWAQTPLSELQVTIQRDVVIALNITVAFNDSQGD